MLCKPFEVGVVGNHVLMLFSQPFLRVHPRLEVPLFRVIGEHPVVIRYWEPVLHDVVDIYFRRVEQLRDVFVPLHCMVVAILPILCILSIPFHYDKISVEQQDNVIFHLLLI